MRTPDPSSSRPRGTRVAATADLGLLYAGTTDVGIRRSKNQDTYLLAPQDDLFVVADGMGGHAAGEVAARLAVDTIERFFRETSLLAPGEIPMPYPMARDMPEADRRLATALKLANSAVFQQSNADDSKHGMGTTVVALHFDDGLVHWAHVGDSRLYRLRGDRLMQLTADHSLLNETITQRQLTGQELRDFVEHFPYKNVLVRAVGVRYNVEVDVGHSNVEDRDVFLLCSDGATNVLPDVDLRRILSESRNDPQSGCDTIVRMANERGGPDNITAVIVEARRSPR
ncbi:MAG: Stp1/IreP family PP2C-type Ser/Thr phosphatase [Bradymonadaceae bacterium]|nr:Stp1/IreP family PP2C-type Ser/Thr phosphatase [Lujinxingiaceae bacterium]